VSRFSHLFWNDDIAEREIMASAMIEAKAIGQASGAQRSETGHQSMSTAGIRILAPIIIHAIFADRRPRRRTT